MKSIGGVMLVAAAPLMTGCATFMKGSINSTPDPTYAFDRSAPMIVTVPPKSRNSLQSKYYISRVVAALRSNGFQAVFTDHDRSRANEPIRIVVFVDVDTETSAYIYRSADYGRVQTVSTTNCNTYGYGNMGSANCTTTPTTSYGAVGRSDKTGYTTDHFTSLAAFDVESKQNVLSLTASSFNSGCAEAKLYDFLADQALSRMSFDQMVKEDFTVRMPHGYRCN